MSIQSHPHQAVASVEDRAVAIESILEDRGMKPGEFIVQATHMIE